MVVPGKSIRYSLIYCSFHVMSFLLWNIKYDHSFPVDDVIFCTGSRLYVSFLLHFSFRIILNYSSSVPALD